LLGQYRFSKLVTQIESRYQYLTGPDREVGNFVDRNVFYNALRASYDYSSKTVFDGEFSQTTALYQQYLDQYNYQAKGGMDYRVTDRTRLGLEGYFGFLDVQDSPLQVYQQARVRARYDLTGKVALKASVGIEFREFTSGDLPLRVDPVFSLGAEYRPFEGTLLSINGYRNSIGSTTLTQQNYDATGVQISIEQKILHKFTLGCAVGYENDTYYATSSGVDAGRVDNYFFVRPSLSYTFISWLNAGVFYEYRNNDSNEAPSSFYNNRVGAEFALQF